MERDIMPVAENGVSIIYAARYRGINVNDVHTHSIFQLYILNNDRLEVYDGKNSCVPDHERELVLIKPGVEHCLRLRYDADTQDWFDNDINCVFDCKFSVEDGELSRKIMSLPRFINVGSTAFYKSAAEIILSALSRNNLKVAHSAFVTMLYSITEMQVGCGFEPVFYTNNSDWHENTLGLKEIKKYIDDNYRSKIELDDIVRLSRMNRSALCREFRKAYATSPIHYILTKRISEARIYLSESSIKISELSESLGFSSPSYFNRVFKKFEGVSPREYRDMHQSESVKY